MSNVAFITTRKYLKSYNILQIFQQINNKKFGGKLIVFTDSEIYSDNQSWHIEYTDTKTFYAIDFYQHSKKKLGSKHPAGSWMQYVMNVFHNEFGVITNAKLSDEGTEGTWLPVKDKYKSYADYRYQLYSEPYHDVSFESYVKNHISFDVVPLEMKNY